MAVATTVPVALGVRLVLRRAPQSTQAETEEVQGVLQTTGPGAVHRQALQLTATTAVKRVVVAQVEALRPAVGPGVAGLTVVMVVTATHRAALELGAAPITVTVQAAQVRPERLS